MARVLFLVWKLGDGGAERQLVNLAKGLDRAGHEVAIAVCSSGGAYERDIERTGIRYEVVQVSRRPKLPRLIHQMQSLVARFRPHAIHGYMEAGNFLAAMLRSPQADCRLVWGVRASELEATSYDINTRVMYWINRPLSRITDLVIANSRAGADYVVSRGYPAAKVKVVYNGIETDRFRHDAEAGARLRAAWGLGPEARLIGMAARLDPMKGHDTFLAAARLLAARRADVRFVCVGEGQEPFRSRIVGALGDPAFGARLRWQGRQEDMPAYYSALDLATLTSSIGEGFSNAVAEAMACGIPCVVTDVGDSAHVVGAAGTVVPAQDPAALADSWERALQAPRPPRADCRARIVENFSIERLVAESEQLLLPAHLLRVAAAPRGMA